MNKFKKTVILVVVFAIAIIINYFSSNKDINIITDFQIHYLDVGQADSSIVFLPDGKTMLIDGGNQDDGRFIANYIHKNGRKNIDYLIATHPHEDHIGGLKNIVDNFDVVDIYMPRVSYNSTIYYDLLSAIDFKGYKIHSAKKGVVIAETAEYKIEILSPTQDEYKDINHYSVILKLTYKDNSFLFTGDAEVVNEAQLSGDISADVLKIGHHGSDTSSSEKFLKEVNPKLAIISVGKDNNYGHPDEKVLERLNKLNITTLRTDLIGTIIIKSDGVNITYEGENNWKYILIE